MASWLVGRPVVEELDHLFVVVASALSARPVAQFSYGPSGGFAGIGGRLVSLTNTATPTHEDDAAAWRALSDTRVALGRGISAVEIAATDAEVQASGRLVDRALGRPDRRGDWPVWYAVLTNPMSDREFANSNSAAYAVAMGALGAGRTQRLPPTSRAPGWQQYRHVLDKVAKCVAA
jgi:hypothetical protein